jgi:SAM-dependent methyltransferase
MNESILNRIIAEKERETYFHSKREFSASPGRPKQLYDNLEQRNLVYSANNKKVLTDKNINNYLRLDIADIPATEDREGYYDNRHLEYWLSGLSDYQKIYSSLKLGISAGYKILDFGGASGRNARHFAAYHPKAEVTVADTNTNHIDYINNRFSGNLRGIKLSNLPVLPFADDYFDFIYAFSVFTHIDTFETSWLAELARVLKPGKKAYLTIHSEHTWSLLPDAHVFNVIKDNPVFQACWHQGQAMPEERIVCSYAPGLDYSCNIFLRNDYIKKVWNKFLKVKDIIFGAQDYQTAVVVSK